MTPTVEELEGQLLSAQLRHTIDLLRAENEKLSLILQNHIIADNRRVAELEKNSQDHEERLRSLAEAATQFRLLAGLATGGGLLALVDLLRALMI